jgi:integrase
MNETHTILGGKVHVYRRPKSSHWQCSTYLAGRNRRQSTKEDSLSKAKEIAEDWYLQLRGKLRNGQIKTERTFREASEQYLREYDIITQGERSKVYVDGQHWRSRVHLVPFFGPMGLSEITGGTVQEYRIHRHQEAMKKRGKPPACNTLHQEIVTLRQTLKTAVRQGWLDHLPDLSEPYRASPKISHRAWFSPEEYKKLYEATRKRAHEPKNPRYKWESEQLHDFVLFMANTGLRPDEAMRLQFRDVTIVEDEATGDRILEIEVRGKRGVGYCKSVPGAVLPFERLKARNVSRAAEKALKENSDPKDAGNPKPAPHTNSDPNPTDPLFPKYQRDLIQGDPGRRRLEVRPRRPAAHRLQPAAHLHLPSPDGGRRHLPDRQELPDQRRDDREILRGAHQDPPRRRRDQRHAAEAPEAEASRAPERPPGQRPRRGLVRRAASRCFLHPGARPRSATVLCKSPFAAV